VKQAERSSERVAKDAFFFISGTIHFFHSGYKCAFIEIEAAGNPQAAGIFA
jgi:hypothetical protein